MLQGELKKTIVGLSVLFIEPLILVWPLWYLITKRGLDSPLMHGLLLAAVLFQIVSIFWVWAYVRAPNN